MALKGGVGAPALASFTTAYGYQFAAATGTAAPIVSSSTPLSSTGLFYLQADAGNSGTIKIGGSNGCYYTLNAGDNLFPMPLADLMALYAIGSAASQNLNVLAVG